MINIDTKLDLKGFEALRKGLTAGEYVKVGVFGDSKSERNQGGITNVALAFIQIFGSIVRKIPPRDFLRMPLEEKRADVLSYAASKPMSDLLLAGNKRKALKLLGVFAETIIQKAFETRGFGKWAPNKPSTIHSKGSASPLINTSQLRRSVGSRVGGV